MKTAIIVLNWNGRSLLEQFLPSLVAYTKQVDIYVIDNASTDDSCVFLSHNYPQIKQVVLDHNYGFAKGYNLGLQQIKADVYCLLNNDIAVTQNWLPPILEAFEKTQVDIAQPLILDNNDKASFEYAGAAGGFIDRYGFAYCRGRIFEAIEQHKEQYDTSDCFWATGACLFIRQTVWEELKGFDEDFFMHQEEIDLCWRAFNKGYKTRCIATSSVYHQGAASLEPSAQKTFYNYRNSLWMLLKNLPNKTLAVVFISRLILDGFAALRYITQGKLASFFMVIKAHFSVYASLRSTLKKRTKQAQKRNYYRHRNLPWKHFILRKNKFYDL